MHKHAQFAFRSGCLVSLLAPLIALLLYPRAKWLFAFVFIGIALLVFAARRRKDPMPGEVAEHAENLLNGTYGNGKWDVDDYEHLYPKNPEVRELWQRTMAVGGLPEEWPQLDEVQKNELRGIIRALRQLGVGTVGTDS